MHSQLISVLNQCAATCDYCAAACLKEEEVHHLSECIRSDIVCSSVCRSTALLLEHEMAEQGALQLCEEICRMCAVECSKHSHEHCQACAKICEACADECKQAMVA